MKPFRNFIALAACALLCTSCLQKEADSKPGLTPGEPGSEAPVTAGQDSVPGDAYGTSKTETAADEATNNGPEAALKNPSGAAAPKKDSVGRGIHADDHTKK